MASFLFGIYRWAWLLLLPPVAALARLDALSRTFGLRTSGRGFLPRTWRVTERLGYSIRERAHAGGSVPRKALWLHCASLGEAKGLWAFALSLSEAPDLALTATTADGAAWLEARCAAFAEARKHGREPAEMGKPGRIITAGIAPFDHPGTVRRFLDAYGAVGLCLYEVELWPNAVSICGDRGLPVVLVSGRLTAKAARLYRRFGRAGARLLDRLAWILAQSPVDRDRFASLTKTEVVAGCDFKAAHYLARSLDPARGPAAPGFPPAPAAPESARSRFAFLSLHYRELILLLPGLPALMARSGILVFPRKMDEIGRFRARLEPLGFGLHSRDPGARHVLVDAMGLIGARLPECHSAFVGGSLVPVGCHNLWEPLLAGLRIHFGPHYGHQEALAKRVIERGLGGVLEDPAGIGALDAPGPDLPAACRDLAEDLRHGLDSALLEGGRRIFATFYPDANAWRDGEATTLAAGIDKGRHR